MNVAVQAHQLARQLGVGNGTIVSCVNGDQRGHKVIDALCWMGMSTRYIGKDSNHPTGLASVFVQSGEPRYQIGADVAWDYIYGTPALKELARECNAVCYGSLAQRSPASRATIRNFLQDASQAIRLYDVNLRRNALTGELGYSPEIVEHSCQAATIIKSNQSELFEIFNLLGIECSDDQSLDGIRRRMEMLLARFPARAIVVTRGADGTIVLARNGEFRVNSSVKPEGTSYPVGAGDACSAGILLGIALGWNLHATMELANRMGADVASNPSATPPLSADTLKFARWLLQK
jgi:fructokinase